MKNYIFHNFGLKIVALILAILTWFYIMGEIEGAGYSQKSIFDFAFPGSHTDKTLTLPADKENPAP